MVRDCVCVRGCECPLAWGQWCCRTLALRPVGYDLSSQTAASIGLSSDRLAWLVCRFSLPFIFVTF